MKLNLIFIFMDLLTVLAYPFIFVYGKLRQFSKPKAGIVQANLSTARTVTLDRYTSENIL